MKINKVAVIGTNIRDYARTHNLIKKVANLFWKLLLYCVVFGLCFIILQPFLLKISSAFMSTKDVLDVTVVYIPKHFSTTFPEHVFKVMEYWKAFFNSLWLSVMVGVLQVFFSALVAYGFARFKFPGRSLLFGLLIFTMVVPPFVTMIPQYLHFQNFDILGIYGLISGTSKGVNILNSVWPFILTSITVTGYKCGLYVYLLRQLYRGLPKELEEAAYLDGCSSFGTYFKIVMPSGTSMMVVCFMLSFVWQWTDSFFTGFYTPNMVTISQKLTSVVALASSSVMDEMGLSMGLTPPIAFATATGNTAVLLAVIPLFLIYLFAQRFLIESIEHSGLK